MAKNDANQIVFIKKVLTQLQRLQVSVAALLFFVITTDSFGAGIFSSGIVGGIFFLLCSFFLLQTAIMYLVFYRTYKSTAYGKQLRLFLINLTVLPLFFIAVGLLSFLFAGFPLVHRAYALALLSLVPISYLIFRQMLSRQFSA
jgi:hypothetical protein